jgi:DNA-binding NtrC family response regulator
MFVNIANAIPSARFSALLVEGDKGLGLETTLREQGCSVRRVSTRDAAQEALETADVVVISAAGFADDEVLELVGRAALAASILVATDSTDLAVKAARLGASTVLGGSVELASAQIGQLLAVVDLKRRVARQSSPSSAASPNSGVVQRRSTPLPKEATPEALDALIEAAEGLVPMHRFQRVYVDYALRRFGGNKVHTAAALGIDRRTIQRWARARADQSPMTSRDLISSS